MTREAAIKKLRRLRGLTDQEAAHIHADNILRELLDTLGYEDVVAEFDNIAKWYA